MKNRLMREDAVIGCKKGKQEWDNRNAVSHGSGGSLFRGISISGYNGGMPFRGSAPAFSGKKTVKTPPPEDTGMEPSYLKALGEKQTPVQVKLHSGESFRGWIEYYDLNMVRLTREGAPNLFIFKHEIMYIAEDNGRRGR